MILKNYCWYFQNVIPHHICDDIIRYGKLKKETVGLIGDLGTTRNVDKNPLTKKEDKILKDKRDSNISWLDDQWVYKEIKPYIDLANKNADWNFDYHCSESCQFTKYNKGQYYDWHQDGWDKVSDQPGQFKGTIRKLSVTVSLSDPKDYEGGELQFDFKRTSPIKKSKIYTCKEILPKGSLVVFPSFVWHRVTKVTKGTRYSLVIWNCGWPFK